MSSIKKSSIKKSSNKKSSIKKSNIKKSRIKKSKFKGRESIKLAMLPTSLMSFYSLNKHCYSPFHVFWGEKVCWL